MQTVLLIMICLLFIKIKLGRLPLWVFIFVQFCGILHLIIQLCNILIDINWWLFSFLSWLTLLGIALNLRTCCFTSLMLRQLCIWLTVSTTLSFFQLFLIRIYCLRIYYFGFRNIVVVLDFLISFGGLNCSLSLTCILCFRSGLIPTSFICNDVFDLIILWILWTPLLGYFT